MNKQHLVQLGELYGRHLVLELSTVSTYAANDGKWLPGLKGATTSCTLRKAELVMQWFSDHWPADLDWPHDIPRPPKTKEKAA
ncbi:hypothetical protein [Frigidibacter oleivorans]|uniref:hypothetical protein n=1 Tax=Frigidibacter oleivorans TaxID=2487129 RepID=UPI000F8D2592|nr:hypothetical protein [Frigidibacter oleivorans]